MKSPHRRRPCLACALAALVAAGIEAARASPTASDACAPAMGDARVTLAEVSKEGDILLADGRSLRLAGLDLLVETSDTQNRSDELSRALLDWASDSVTLHALGAPDRWGRIPALLFCSEDPPEAADALLAAGLARVAPEAAVHACAARWLSVEEAARRADRGLWDDPGAAVLAPGDVAGLTAQAGGLALVQGVLRVHESRGALFLALERGRRGFVAVVSRRDAKLFAKAGLDLRDYVGTPVRLRGILDARFGPRMRLADPDAVESLEPGSIREEPGPVSAR